MSNYCMRMIAMVKKREWGERTALYILTKCKQTYQRIRKPHV